MESGRRAVDTIAFLGSPVRRGERALQSKDTGWACEALETASTVLSPCGGNRSNEKMSLLHKD